MKKLICSLLTMIVLLGCVPTVNGYAATEENFEVQKVVCDYMEMRLDNMQGENEIAWDETVVTGIARDESLYAGALKEKSIEILEASYEMLSITGKEIVEVVLLEKLEIRDVSGENTVEIYHKICVVQKDNKEYVVVSDEYYDAYINFASASYVDETALVNPCAFGGSPLCILHVANNEVGYCEKETNAYLDNKTANAGNKNFTKYGAWYGLNGDMWCAMFVSWCANQAQVATNVIPKFALTEDGMQRFQSWGRFKNSIQYGGNYTPQPGDIFFLAHSATDTYHTGIVLSVSGNTMICIEGNTTNNMVEIKSRSLTATSLRGFGTPNYARNEHFWETVGSVVKCTICGSPKFEY